MTDKTSEAAAKSNRVFALEYGVVKTRDAIRTIARSLEDFATSDAVANMSDEETAVLFGTVSLLGYVADDCDRLYWEGAKNGA